MACEYLALSFMVNEWKIGPKLKKIMFLSFIIPVYNCETYIRKCLERIANVNLNPVEFEVVLVDDGSKDRSALICAEYAGKYGNIRFFQQQNDGPATARNKGLDQAKGEFVWFVDADDAIVPSIFEKLKDTIIAYPEADLISFGYVSQYPDHEMVCKMVESETVCTGLDFLNRRGGSFLWNNLYRRSSIGNKRFINGVHHIEDSCFNIQTIINYKEVVILPDVRYYYNRKNVNSISQGRRLRDRVKANDDSFIVYNTLYSDMQKTTDEQKKNFLWQNLNFSIAAHLYTMLRFDNARTIKRYIAEYRRMGLYPLEKTGNRKSDRFLLLANHEHLLLAVKNFGMWCYSISRGTKS
jgi:glycosyltransferase involved in cell wall biosynthesis